MAKRIEIDETLFISDKQDKSSKSDKLSKPSKLDKPDKPMKPSLVSFAFKANKKQIKKMKDVAYWERKKIKTVFEEALTLYLKDKNVKKRPRENE